VTEKNMTLSVDVINVKGEKVDTVDLSPAVFGVKAPVALVHEVVTAYLANQRRGTHSTKTRGEVSGGGAKPWKQKHTGRARSGSTRSPLWRHGGIIFGPKPHGYYQNVSTEKRQLALRAVLSDLVKEGRFKVVDSFAVSEPKTKRVVEIAKKLGMPVKTVVVMDKIDDVLERASRNVAGLRLCLAQNLNSYDVLNAEQLVVTRPALEQIAKRLDGAAGAA
jgi:large subunit ribosomal protein L4